MIVPAVKAAEIRGEQLGTLQRRGSSGAEGGCESRKHECSADLVKDVGDAAGGSGVLARHAGGVTQTQRHGRFRRPTCGGWASRSREIDRWGQR
jgi:hypothetical protein